MIRALNALRNGNPHWLRDTLAVITAIIVIGGGLLLVTPNIGGI